ncbi:hypothetical protein [Silanimonas sp.]|uniref:ABC transporter permease n=1 Tax=Silanimonas sp. TaxID=1929290 RepID=UPI001BBDB1A1|nr:hypothetical protein [Silanimonas sp.]MBS3896712.1 hypothetical protein [Silanimonas sp.]
MSAIFRRILSKCESVTVIWGGASFFSFSPFRSSMLVASAVLVVSSLLFATALFQSILLHSVSGIQPEGNYVTLAARSSAGEFVGALGRELDVLELTLGQSRLVRYSVGHEDEDLNGDTIRRRVAFVSTGFFGELRPEMYSGAYPEDGERAVVVSYEYAIKRFGTPDDALDDFVQFTASESVFRISGVASPIFVGLGGEKVDVFLASDWRPDFLTIDIPGVSIPEDSIPSLRRRLAAELPVYGLLRISGNDERRALDELVSNTRSVAAPIVVGSLSLTLNEDTGRRLIVVNGIDLEPDKTALMQEYIGYLGSLCVLMSMMLLLNYSMHLLSMLPKRLTELRLRLAFGATFGGIFRRLYLEQAWFFPVALVLALPITVLAVELSSSLPGLVGNDQEPFVKLTAIAIAFAVVLLMALQAIATCAPLLAVKRFFSGGGTVSESPGARLTRSTAGAVLFFVSCVAIGIVVLMAIQIHRMSTVDIGVSDAFVSPIHAMHRAPVSELNSRLGDQFSFSDARVLGSLGQSTTFSAPGAPGSPRAMANIVRVSNNWPVKMALALVDGSLDSWCSSRGVLANSSFVRAIGLDPAELVGHEVVSSAGEQRSFTIKGIVGDVRYDQLYGEFPAVLYACGEAPQEVVARDGFVTFSQPWEPRFAYSASKDGWGRIGVHRPESLRETLATRTELERFLASSALFAGLMTLLLAFLGLCAETISLMHARQRELALRFCLGATRAKLAHDLFVERIRGGVLALIMSATLAVFSRDAISNHMAWYSSSDLMIVLLVIAATFCIIAGLLSFLFWTNLRVDLIGELRRER